MEGLDIFSRFWEKDKRSIKHALALFSFIFVVWSLYRYFPNLLPAWFEELILKPLTWLGPTFWVVRKIEKEKLSSLGLTKENLFPSIYWGLGLGMVFTLEGLLTNIFKYQGLKLASLEMTPGAFLGAVLLSFITALTEETVFRGYLLNRLKKKWQNDWLANLVTALFFALIYLPMALFVLSYRPLVLLTYLFFVFIYGLAAGFVFLQTGNLVACVLLHVFWSWPIILFR